MRASSEKIKAGETKEITKPDGGRGRGAPLGEDHRPRRLAEAEPRQGRDAAQTGRCAPLEGRDRQAGAAHGRRVARIGPLDGQAQAGLTVAVRRRMGLERYREKRNFRATPEPRGTVARGKAKAAELRHPEARGESPALRLPARAGRRPAELGGAQGPEPRSRTTSGWRCTSKTIRSNTAASKASFRAPVRRRAR